MSSTIDPDDHSLPYAVIDNYEPPLEIALSRLREFLKELENPERKYLLHWWGKNRSSAVKTDMLAADLKVALDNAEAIFNKPMVLAYDLEDHGQRAAFRQEAAGIIRRCSTLDNGLKIRNANDVAYDILNSLLGVKSASNA